MLTCKLCLASPCRPAGQTLGRRLLHCPACGLGFVPDEHWLSVDDERRRYQFHDNAPGNAGYRRFLGQVTDVVAALTPRPTSILDFGSGELAVLTGLLIDRGHACTAYDPLYGLGSPAGTYNLVILCEVLEHLRDLRGELHALRGRLARDGRVLVRTQPYPAVDEIPAWWYSRDSTHINFAAPETFTAMLPLLNLTRVERPADDLFLLA